MSVAPLTAREEAGIEQTLAAFRDRVANPEAYKDEVIDTCTDALMAELEIDTQYGLFARVMQIMDRGDVVHLTHERHQTPMVLHIASTVSTRDGVFCAREEDRINERQVSEYRRHDLWEAGWRLAAWEKNPAFS